MPSVNDDERLRYERGEDPWGVSDMQNEARDLQARYARQDTEWSRRADAYEASVALLVLLVAVGILLTAILT